MANKGKTKSTRKVKNLKVKSLSAGKAKQVKGADNAGATDDHRKFRSS